MLPYDSTFLAAVSGLSGDSCELVISAIGLFATNLAATLSRAPALTKSISLAPVFGVGGYAAAVPTKVRVFLKLLRYYLAAGSSPSSASES